MNLIIVVVVLLILFGGGGFYYGGPVRWRRPWHDPADRPGSASVEGLIYGNSLTRRS